MNIILKVFTQINTLIILLCDWFAKPLSSIMLFSFIAYLSIILNLDTDKRKKKQINNKAI